MHRTSIGLACIVLGLAVLFRSVGANALEVFACEPEWAALATELGGDKVEVFSATTARQDPHQIQARPALIARLRSAELVVCTGAELEIGWIPMLLRQAANARVQPGTAGYLEAAQHVRLLDKPTRLDRAEGDIHPAGNPHIQTDPRNIAAVAAVLARRMAEIDPKDAAVFSARNQSFAGRWNAAMQRWAQQAAPLRGATVATYHKGWAYLEDWLGLREVATIEPKSELPAKGVRGVICAAYEDPRASEFVAERVRVPAIMLPYTVGGSERARDLFGLFEDTVERLTRGLGGGASAGR